MPIYEYRCKACGSTHEIEHGFNDERPTVCPACGKPQLVRVFHPVGVLFKGSGFHKTDYSGAGAKKAASGSSDAKGDSGTASSAKSEASGKADTPKAAAESKPASKESKPKGKS